MRHGWILIIAVTTLAFVACGPPAAGEKGTEIIEAKDALEWVDAGADVILVDANTAVTYKKRHAAGAVNVPRTAIVVDDPVINSVAPPARFAEAMSAVGIGNDTLVLVYDDNKNMDAARLWWTLKFYGHDEVKVISGGLEALARAGAEVTSDVPAVTPAAFTSSSPRSPMIIETKAVRGLVEEPAAGTVIVDTRSVEEFNEGTIPGSVCLDFTGNNFTDGTFRPVRHIRIRHLEQGIDYDDTAVLFCKTSIRGAQTYLALFNAGYRDLKLYDAAWVGWTANPMNPVYVPDAATARLDDADQS